MRACGIDPSTKTGMVMIGEYTAHAVVKHEDRRGTARLEAIQTSVRGQLEIWQPDLVVIEGYGYANKFTLTLMVEIGVLIRMCLHDLGIPWYICPPSVLKKYATGNGAAKKPQVAEAVQSRWGFTAPSDDVVDAYVLAQIAQDVAGTGISTALKGLERG